MKVSNILKNKGDFVATVAPSDPVTALLATLAEHSIGAVVVSADGATIAGIASERDVVRALQANGPSILDGPVSAIMTALHATCEPGTTVDQLMEQMTNERVRHIPVLDDGAMVGIVSIGDVVKARMDQLIEEHKSLVNYITS